MLNWCLIFLLNRLRHALPPPIEDSKIYLEIFLSKSNEYFVAFCVIINECSFYNYLINFRFRWSRDSRWLQDIFKRINFISSCKLSFHLQCPSYLVIIYLRHLNYNSTFMCSAPVAGVFCLHIFAFRFFLYIITWKCWFPFLFIAYRKFPSRFTYFCLISQPKFEKL